MIRSLTTKTATSAAIPPKKNSIPARIFTYKGGFSAANPNNVEHYVYDTQDKLLEAGYVVADKSAINNAKMFELAASGNAAYQFAVLIENGLSLPVLIFIGDFTAYEQFMLRYGLLTAFIDRYLPSTPEQTVPMHHIIESPAQPKYW